MTHGVTLPQPGAIGSPLAVRRHSPGSVPSGCGVVMASIAPSEDLKTAMAVIEAVMIVGMTLTQVAAITVPFVPGAREQLRDFLTSFGVNVDA